MDTGVQGKLEGLRGSGSSGQTQGRPAGHLSASEARRGAAGHVCCPWGQMGVGVWADRLLPGRGSGSWACGGGHPGNSPELLNHQGLMHHFHLVGSLLPGGSLLPTPLQPPQTWAFPESLCPKGRAGGAAPCTSPTCSIQGPQGPRALGRAGSRPGGAARPPSRSFPGCLQDAGLCPEAEGRPPA